MKGHGGGNELEERKKEKGMWGKGKKSEIRGERYTYGRIGGERKKGRRKERIRGSKGRGKRGERKKGRR